MATARIRLFRGPPPSFLTEFEYPSLTTVSWLAVLRREFFAVRTPLLMAFAAAVLATGCGGGRPSHPFYETTTYRHEAVSRDYRAALVKHAKTLARAGKLRRRNAKGKVTRIKTAQVKTLKLGTLRAIHMVSDEIGRASCRERV